MLSHKATVGAGHDTVDNDRVVGNYRRVDVGKVGLLVSDVQKLAPTLGALHVSVTILTTDIAVPAFQVIANWTLVRKVPWFHANATNSKATLLTDVTNTAANVAQ